MTIRSVLAAATLALAAAPAAQAAIIIEVDMGGVSPTDDALFDGSTGLSLIGITDLTSESVTVFGGESLFGIANRSRVRAEDMWLGDTFAFRGNIDQSFAFDLTNPARTFTSVGFDINRGRGTAKWGTLTFVTIGGQSFQQIVRLGRDGMIVARATDGDRIDYVTMGFDGTVQDVRNIRFGGLAAIPEPAAWGMMIVGFGGVGAAVRARRRYVAS